VARLSQPQAHACATHDAGETLESAAHWPATLVLDSVVFDLDGTLWDTCSACALGWNNVLTRNEIAFRRITADDVRRVAGRAHDACIRHVFQGLPEQQLALLIEETQHEDNVCVAAHGGELYAGVSEGLRALAARLPLFIVSNCQAGYIETFLTFHGFAALFRDFECWGNTKLSKAANLQRVITRNQLRAPLMVGDTDGDQAAAEACGVPFVHASYGFGGCPSAALRTTSFSALTAQLLMYAR
jgi:phosphoglycolate phosphatase